MAGKKSKISNKKSGKQKQPEIKKTFLSFERLVYSGAFFIGIIALIAFIYSMAFPINFFIGSGNAANIPDTVRVNISYSLELEDGTMILSGTGDYLEGFVGKSLGVSSKIDAEIAKMAEGEEQSFTLAPSEAFGDYDPAKVVEVNRTEKILRKAEIQKLITLSVEGFVQEFGESPKVNMTAKIDNLPWDYKVVSIYDGEVVLSREVKEGQMIPVNELFFVIISEVKGNSIVTMLHAENQTIETPTGNLTIMTEPEYLTMTLTPPIGERIQFGDDIGTAKAVRYDSEKIILDYNKEYAGKEITARIKLLGRGISGF